MAVRTAPSFRWSEVARRPADVGAALDDRLVKDPRQTENRDWHGPLKGAFGRATVNGVVLEQWQYEIAGGGRVWCVVQDDGRIVWITRAAARHPNETN